MLAEKELRPLFFLQEKLDNRIEAKFVQDEDIQKEHHFLKVLSFKVEVGELLNTLRVHKYWSTKGRMEREVILEEYADGLHFLLSIGGDKKMTAYKYVGIHRDFTERDIAWICDQLLSFPWTDFKKEEYTLGLEMYLKLGELIGFTWEDIEKGYVAKNIMNHERQEAGY